MVNHKSSSSKKFFFNLMLISSIYTNIIYFIHYTNIKSKIHKQYVNKRQFREPKPTAILPPTRTQTKPPPSSSTKPPRTTTAQRTPFHYTLAIRHPPIKKKKRESPPSIIALILHPSRARAIIPPHRPFRSFAFHPC